MERPTKRHAPAKKVAEKKSGKRSYSSQYEMANKGGYATDLYKAKIKAGSVQWLDIATGTYALDTTGTITHLNVVKAGTGPNTRTDRNIAMKSIQFRGYIEPGATCLSNDCCVILVYDKKPRGQLPAITDILNASSAYAMNRLENSGRFRIVRRWNYVTVGSAASGSTIGFTSMSHPDFDEFVPLKGLTTVYDSEVGDDSGAIAHVSEGALYMITLGNPVGATATANLNVTIRLRFVDV